MKTYRLTKKIIYLYKLFFRGLRLIQTDPEYLNQIFVRCLNENNHFKIGQ
jgi:hypothetical protein